MNISPDFTVHEVFKKYPDVNIDDVVVLSGHSHTGVLVSALEHKCLKLYHPDDWSCTDTLHPDRDIRRVCVHGDKVWMADYYTNSVCEVKIAHGDTVAVLYTVSEWT
jgi:hypothetical protein